MTFLLIWLGFGLIGSTFLLYYIFYSEKYISLMMLLFAFFLSIFGFVIFLFALINLIVELDEKYKISNKMGNFFFKILDKLDDIVIIGKKE